MLDTGKVAKKNELDVTWKLWAAGSVTAASGSSEQASRQLTVKLQQLAADGDPEGAMELFNLAVAHDAVNVRHWNLIQNLGFTESSAERRGVINQMVAAGVQPDTATYTTLANRLLLEGSTEEAHAVIEIEMPAAGVSPNSRTLELLEKTDTMWSKLRTSHLNRLVNSATKEGRKQAEAFFQILLTNRAADMYQIGVMKRRAERKPKLNKTKHTAGCETRSMKEMSSASRSGQTDSFLDAMSIDEKQKMIAEMEKLGSQMVGGQKKKSAKAGVWAPVMPDEWDFDEMLDDDEMLDEESLSGSLTFEEQPVEFLPVPTGPRSSQGKGSQGDDKARGRGRGRVGAVQGGKGERETGKGANKREREKQRREARLATARAAEEEAARGIPGSRGRGRGRGGSRGAGSQ